MRPTGENSQFGVYILDLLGYKALLYVYDSFIYKNSLSLSNIFAIQRIMSSSSSGGGGEFIPRP